MRIKEALISKGSSILMTGKANAPTIKTYSGLGLISIGSVWGCIQTLNMGDLLKERNETLDDIRDSFSVGELSEKKYLRALTKTYCVWGLKILKNYAGPIALQILGYTLVFSGHNDAITRISALATLLSERTEQNNRLEKAIRETYGDEVLMKLKRGEPIGEIGEIPAGSDEAVMRPVYDEDSTEFGFEWGPGMGDFCPHDNAMNYKIVRQIELEVAMTARKYGWYAAVNDIYRRFGANHKVRSIYDVECVGFPNSRGEKGDYKCEFTVTELPFGDTIDQTAPSLWIDFKNKPISCLEINKRAGFQFD